jgi:hypothetical protein
MHAKHILVPSNIINLSFNQLSASPTVFNPLKRSNSPNVNFLKVFPGWGVNPGSFAFIFFPFAPEL